MNKPDLLRLILTQLTDELETLTRGARASYAAATDPDSKAENKYDTRTLEASYVARGQAQRVAEVQEAMRHFQVLQGRAAEAHEEVAIGSVLRLTDGTVEDCYFMGPAAGGTEVQFEGREVLVITPTSPLGQKLMGKRVGETVTLQPGRPALRLVSVA